MKDFITPSERLKFRGHITIEIIVYLITVFLISYVIILSIEDNKKIDEKTVKDDTCSSEIHW